MLTGWLGVGTALARGDGDAGGARSGCGAWRATWPFFDDLLAKIEMVCAKTDLEIARAYVEQLGGDIALLDRLEAEFERTVDAVLRDPRAPSTCCATRRCCSRRSRCAIRTSIRCRCCRSRCCEKRALPEGESEEREKVERCWRRR